MDTVLECIQGRNSAQMVRTAGRASGWLMFSMLRSSRSPIWGFHWVMTSEWPGASNSDTKETPRAAQAHGMSAKSRREYDSLAKRLRPATLGASEYRRKRAYKSSDCCVL